MVGWKSWKTSTSWHRKKKSYKTQIPVFIKFYHNTALYWLWLLLCYNGQAEKLKPRSCDLKSLRSFTMCIYLFRKNMPAPQTCAISCSTNGCGPHIQTQCTARGPNRVFKPTRGKDIDIHSISRRTSLISILNWVMGEVSGLSFLYYHCQL